MISRRILVAITSLALFVLSTGVANAGPKW